MSRRRISLEELLAEIAALEAQYGVSTEDRHLIAGGGDPCAAEDVQRWDALALARDRASAATG
jgi:hypothetical protein